ncbi:hypothetical protein N7481_000804 [Penicillium waksmanii]|uniref:uncharacterized protein n=1 Tax=Penicillium waksmanii TaxID=69791 RepID=UPI0025467EF3|nr:uncharacterized protein N7481_000804 [Penicillium waksmanii]KAJ6000395.1 hypothetical protein N7481_000804 [Penicillium waksmanii]
MLTNICSGDQGSEYTYMTAVQSPMLCLASLLSTNCRILGENHIMALGNAWSSASVAAELGRCPALGPAAALKLLPEP